MNLQTLFSSRVSRVATRSVAGSRSLAMLLATMSMALLTHCGGDGKTGSNGTGSVPLDDPFVASGPVTTLGPTGISGVAFLDAAAQVQINAQVSRPVSELRLGMFAEAGGLISTSSASGRVTTLIAQSAVTGPVIALDPAAQRLTVLTQTVQLDQNTILDGFTSLAGLAIGSRVEVYGLPQPQSNTITATRVVALPASGSTEVEILGSATSLTATQFNLRGVTVSTNNAVLIVAGIQPSPAPAITSIGENARVRVIGTYDPASNTLMATRVVSGLEPVRNDNSVLVLDGLVQSVRAAGLFRVNDTDVDAVAVGAGLLVPGAHVQLRGRKVAGTLVASEFRLIAANARIEYVVQGPISDFVSTMNFKVRGETINAGTALIVGGTPAMLANGREVRVKAVAGPGHLVASEVTLVQ